MGALVPCPQLIKIDMKKAYSIPATKIMTMATMTAVLVASGSGSMTIGADDIGLGGNTPDGRNPGDAI